MRRRRTFKYIALLVGLLVLGALFLFACAADPGDVSKLGETNVVNTNTNSATMQVSQSDTGISTGSSTGTTTTESSTGTGTTGSSTGVSTGTGTGSSTGSSTGTTGTSTSTESTMTGADATAPCTTCKIELGYASDNPTASGGAAFEIWLINNGSSAFDPTTATINYYFTADGLTDPFQFNVYTAQENTSAMTAYLAVAAMNVTGTVSAFTPSTSTADSVLAITFAAGTPPIPPGEYLYFKGELHDAAYSMSFVQTNDFSFNASDTAQTDNMNIVVDVGGASVWGTPP